MEPAFGSDRARDGTHAAAGEDQVIRRPVLLAEALATLGLASLLIALLPFRRIATLASRGQPKPPATSMQARDIERAIDVWARRVPWRAVCFQRGLAAQLMLRRRGLAAALHYGAARDDDGRLVTHVWVRSGNVDVTGCHGVERYAVLAVFPATEPPGGGSA